MQTIDQQLSDHETRIQKLEGQVPLCSSELVSQPSNAGDATRRMVQDLIDRACKTGLPNTMGLSEFEDYIRSLYPMLYGKAG